MVLRLITADERLSDARRKTTIAVFGPPSIGKTRLVLTLKRPTLFVEMDAGMNSVEDFRPGHPAWGAHIRAETWLDLAEIGCLIAGPDPVAQPNDLMSAAHHNAVVQHYGKAIDLSPFRILFIDSITVMSRLCAAWAKGRPEAFTDKGHPNNFGLFGLIAREMIRFLTHFQRTPGLDVVFVGILERQIDDLGRVSFAIQLEGTKTGRELPGIMDTIVTMDGFLLEANGVRHAHGEPDSRTSFLCRAENPYGLPGKDRAGKLNLFEPPDLGLLMEKLTRPHTEAAV